MTQYVEGDAKTTSFYFLKDDGRASSRSRTSKRRPMSDPLHRYRTWGPHPIFDEPYISEEGRVPKTVQIVVRKKDNRLLIYGLIGALS